MSRLPIQGTLFSCLVTKEGVQYLIVVADQWQMTDVKDLCAKFMEQQLEPANCLGKDKNFLLL